MKKVLVILLLLILACFNAYADNIFDTDKNKKEFVVGHEDGVVNALSQGSISLSGKVSISIKGGDLYDQTDILLNPSIEYFIATGFGLSLEAEIESITQTSTTISKYMGLISGSYYFGANQGLSFNPYLTLGTGIGLGSNSETYLSFKAGFGILFFLSKSVSLDLNARFMMLSINPDGTTTATSGTDFTIMMGIKAFIF